MVTLVHTFTVPLKATVTSVAPADEIVKLPDGVPEAVEAILI